MEEEKPKKKRKKAPIKREPSSSLEMAEREETRPKVKKASEESEKEHKAPWQNQMATPAEVRAFLEDHVFLRHNVITNRVECRLPETDPFEKDWFAGFPKGVWMPISDRIVNTLWEMMSLEKPVGVEPGEFMPVARAKQIVCGSMAHEISDVRLGRAFSELGFTFKRTKFSRGYIVVQRSSEEIRSRMQMLAVTDDG